MLLVFLAPNYAGAGGWLLIENDRVASRGADLADMPAGVRTVAAVVPGEEVGLHWLDLPIGLAPAQAQAAARLLAADVSAQPLADVHVAVGREGEVGALRPVALTQVAAMERWLATLHAIGLDPDLILPDIALLPAPEQGFLRFDRDGIALWRGPEAAFALEGELAELVVGEAPVATLESDGFEAALPALVERPLVNLRQGPFAKRRPWRLQGPRLRRLALLALLLAAVTLMLQIAQIMAYSFAADRAEADTRRIAATALSRSPGASGAADLSRRLAELRGGGVGFSTIAGAVFTAIQAVPNVELAALAFGVDGSLRISARGDSPATLATLASRIEAAGYAVDRLAPRATAGGQLQDMTVRPR